MIYQIRIKGHLDSQWTDWFEGLTITLEENGETLLAGPVVDDAALHGLLKKVHDLGMPLLSVKRVEPDQAEMRHRSNRQVQFNETHQHRSKKGEKKMNTSKKTARMVGALFLISNVVFLLGAFVFVEPILGAPDYLTLVSANRTQVILGVLLELVNGIAYVGIAVLVFPILRQRFESMALWYVGFRIIEFVMQTLSDLSPLSLVRLSEEFVRVGAPESSSFQALGTLLLAERYWAFQMVTIALVLGALIFYYMLYQSRLIPRFISVWGLIGAIAVLATAMLDTFGISPGSLEFLGVLMLLNELFLGVWLIVKGFNPSAIASPSAQQN